MAQLQKNKWESRNQAQNRIQKEQIEDQLINQFISELEPKDWGEGNPTEYSEMGPDEQLRYDILSYKFYAASYEQAKRDNPIFEGIEFENYLKISRPEREFERTLRTPDAEGISVVWDDVYNNNSNVMKASALKGRMAAMAASDAQEKSKQS
jgi:hypothetical protein